MKNIYTFLLFGAFMFCEFSAGAQTVWTGPPITFTKQANADWTLQANQDRITNNVWITRANNQGLFNIKTETSYDQPGTSNGISPQDTEWAIGTTANLPNLTFTTWVNSFNWSAGGGPPDLLNVDMVVHLITDDIYIDIKLLSWGMGNAGGGSFSYERSTNNLSTDQFQSNATLRLYPNPGKSFVKINGLNGSVQYKLYNILGNVIQSGTMTSDQEINIRDLSRGAYFFKLENGATLKFIKE